MTLHLLHRHVLEDHLAGFEAGPNPNHLSIIRSPSIVTVIAHSGHEASVAQALIAEEDASVRACGPGEWLVVAEPGGGHDLLDKLGQLDGVSLCDHSDGKVRMVLSGPSVRKILAKCLAVDLHPAAFPVGRATNLLCCHVACNLARTGDDVFELMVPRSLAGSVFEEMMEMGREYALTASFAPE
jgi:sarcosine oxidase subunit gamma